MPEVTWGKWSGSPFQKVPPLELLWLAAHAPEHDIREAAAKETKNRGLSDYRVLITYHAIDRLSQRYIRIYQAERRASEGIVGFLHRVTETAFSKRYKTKKAEHYRYLNIRFVISIKNGIPVLKTIY